MNLQKHVPNAVFLRHFAAYNPRSPAEDIEGYGLSNCSCYDPPAVCFIPTFHRMLFRLFDSQICSSLGTSGLLTSKLHMRTWFPSRSYPMMNPETSGSMIQCSIPTCLPITGRRSALMWIVIIVSSGKLLSFVLEHLRCAYTSILFHIQFLVSRGLCSWHHHIQ